MLACSAKSWARDKTQGSTIVIQTSSTDVWRSEQEGGPDRRPSTPLEHGDRPRVHASMFPRSHGLGDKKLRGWCNLRPSPLSEGEEAKNEAGRCVWKLRMAMVVVIAMLKVEVAGQPGC